MTDEMDLAEEDRQPGGEKAEAGGFTPLWRRIEAQIRDWIVAGDYPPGAQLPPDRQLSEMLGANRLTVRRALASLAQQGVLRVEHGVGTFVEQRIPYKFGERVRFNENFRASNLAPSRKVVRTRLIEADQRLAERLSIPLLAAVMRLDLIGYANDVPISAGYKYCSHDRFPTITDVFRREQSFTASFRSFGVTDLRRRFTHIVSRMPTGKEAKALQQSKLSPVLGFESIDEDAAGVPVSFNEGCYSGDRIMLVIEGHGD